MPIIRSSERQEKEQLRLTLDVSILEKVRQYCEWAGVTKLEEFFQQAAEYVLSKDRGWTSHAKIVTAVSSDVMQDAVDAGPDQ